MTFSIADTLMANSPGCSSLSIVEGLFSILEAHILNRGRAFIYSGTLNLKYSRWINGESEFLPLLRIIIDELLEESLEYRLTTLASLVSLFSNSFHFAHLNSCISAVEISQSEPDSI